MNIIGIVAYAMLVFLAVSGAWLLRVNLNLSNFGTALSSLMLIIFAITIPVFHINRLHALWMMPIGMLFGTFILMTRLSPLFFLHDLLRPAAWIYLRLLRIGIPKERLLQADFDNQQRIKDMVENMVQRKQK